jgi:lysophospholipase L1-like esterase
MLLTAAVSSFPAYADDTLQEEETTEHVHQYTSTVTTKSTCTKAGERTYVCQCGDRYTEPLPLLSHNYKATVVKPTYQTKGYTLYQCTVCLQSYKTSYTAVLKKVAISKAKISGLKSQYTYTGKAIKPTLTVTYGKKSLKSGTDYTITYSNNKKVGQAKLVITGKSGYTGKITKTFYIAPKKSTISSLKVPKEKQITIKWKKDSQASGYQIQYSTKKNMKSAKKVTISGYKNNKKTLTKLTGGKTYYFRIRTYKKINGKKVFGPYSKISSAKLPKHIYGVVPESKRVSSSYFSDTAFVGDSISYKLALYQDSTHALGNAKFFAAGSLSAANALWSVSSSSVHPLYNGTKTLVEDCIKYSGVKKVYIMLGMNDIGGYGLEKSLNNYIELIRRIKAKSPNVEIFIESVTPLASTSSCLGSINNNMVKEYNQMLKKLCKEKGWFFVDVGSVMYDASGQWLNTAYCSDLSGMGIHFTNAGCEAWVDYLYTHTVDFS